MLIADDEPLPENADDVGKYLLPASAGLGRGAGILSHMRLTQPIERTYLADLASLSRSCLVSAKTSPSKLHHFCETYVCRK